MQPDEKDSDSTLHQTTTNNIEEDLDAHNHDILSERVNDAATDTSDAIFTAEDTNGVPESSDQPVAEKQSRTSAIKRRKKRKKGPSGQIEAVTKERKRQPGSKKQEGKASKKKATSKEKKIKASKWKKFGKKVEQNPNEDVPYK